jgi:RND family efflux transporter MFP subunit
MIHTIYVLSRKKTIDFLEHKLKNFSSYIQNNDTYFLYKQPIKQVLSALTFTLCSFFSSTAPATATELDCLIKPEMYVDLSSPVDSVIKDILVKSGDNIVKGQTLVQLDSSVEKARVTLARKQAFSTTEIELRKVQLKYARLNDQRIRNLYGTKAISEVERDKSATELALAKIELAKSRENIQIAKLNLKLVDAQLALKTLSSPINGVVVDINTREGESVADRPIMKLAQIDPLKVELIVSTEYFGLIVPGMEVEIQPELPKNKRFTTAVTMVDQLIDPASGTFTVHIALPNPDNLLVGGVNCLALFNFDLANSSLL